MHTPSWLDLQTVEALVRLGTIKGAGRELGVEHSSVSRRIDGIEKQLGAPLFVRGPRLRPTPLALRIAVRAAAMGQEAKAIEALLHDERRDRAQQLVITTNDVLASLLFGALARAGLEQTIRVRVTDAEVELTPGVTDFALRPGSQPDASLRGWRLGRLRVGVFAARRHRPLPLPEGERVGVRANRRREAWIHPSDSLRARASMRWWKDVPPLAPGAIECDTLLSMRDACVAGLGRAALPFALVQHDPLELVRELDAGPPLWLLASATRRADRALQETGARLMSTLRDALAA